MEFYVVNNETSVNGMADKFVSFLKETGAVSLQPYEAAVELFSARKAEFIDGDYYIIGNTFIFDNVYYDEKPVVLAKNDSNLVDFKRTDVVSLEMLKVFLRKLIAGWVEDLFLKGSHFSSDTTEDEQRKEIMHDMCYWNDTFDTSWTAFDPDDRACSYWIGQYKTKEDREGLFV